MITSTGVRIGLLSGLLFFAHAMVPGSHAWPLIWPLLGGGVAVYLVSRRGGPQGFGDSVRASATAGLAAAGLFLVATTAALFVLSQPGLASIGRQLGAQGQVEVNSTVLLALLAAAVLGTVAATLSGALTHPLVRRSV